MTIHTVNTDISISLFVHFVEFIKQNNIQIMPSMYMKEVRPGQTDTLICYAYSDLEDAGDFMTYLKLSGEDVETAFNIYYKQYLKTRGMCHF